MPDFVGKLVAKIEARKFPGFEVIKGCEPYETGSECPKCKVRKIFVAHDWENHCDLRVCPKCGDVTTAFFGDKTVCSA